jgi:hypothetical protein
LKGRFAIGIRSPDVHKADKSVDRKIPRRDPGPGRGSGGVQVKKGFRGRGSSVEEGKKRTKRTKRTKGFAERDLLAASGLSWSYWSKKRQNMNDGQMGPTRFERVIPAV